MQALFEEQAGISTADVGLHLNEDNHFSESLRQAPPNCIPASPVPLPHNSTAAAHQDCSDSSKRPENQTTGQEYLSSDLQSRNVIPVAVGNQETPDVRCDSLPHLSSSYPERQVLQDELNYQPNPFQNKSLKDKERSCEYTTAREYLDDSAEITQHYLADVAKLGFSELKMLCRVTCPGVKIKKETNSAYYIQLLMDNYVTFGKLKTGLYSIGQCDIADKLGVKNSATSDEDGGPDVADHLADSNKQGSASMPSHDHRKQTDKGHFPRQYRVLSHTAEEVGAHVPEPSQNDSLGNNEQHSTATCISIMTAAMDMAQEGVNNAQTTVVAFLKSSNNFSNVNQSDLSIELLDQSNITNENNGDALHTLVDVHLSISDQDIDVVASSLTRKEADNFCRHIFPGSPFNSLHPEERLRLQALSDSVYVKKILSDLRYDERCLTLHQLKKGLHFIGKAEVAEVLDGNNNSSMVSSTHHTAFDKLETQLSNETVIAILIETLDEDDALKLLSQQGQHSQDLRNEYRGPDLIRRVAEYMLQENSIEKLKTKLDDNGCVESVIQLENYGKLTDILEARIYLTKYFAYLRNLAQQLVPDDGRVNPVLLHIVLSLQFGEHDRSGLVPVAALFPIYEKNANKGFNFDDSMKNRVRDLRYLLIIIVLEVLNDTHYVTVICCLEKEGVKCWIFCDSGSCYNRKEVCLKIVETVLKSLGLLADKEKVKELPCKLHKTGRDGCGYAVIYIARSCSVYYNLDELLKAITGCNFKNRIPEIKDDVYRLLWKYF